VYSVWLTRICQRRSRQSRTNRDGPGIHTESYKLELRNLVTRSVSYHWRFRHSGYAGRWEPALRTLFDSSSIEKRPALLWDAFVILRFNLVAVNLSQFVGQQRLLDRIAGHSGTKAMTTGLNAADFDFKDCCLTGWQRSQRVEDQHAVGKVVL